MNIVWFLMIIGSLLYSVLVGNTAATTASLMPAAQDAIVALIGMCGAYVFWCGLLKIAEKSGVVRACARLLRRPLGLLFPQSARDPEVVGAIAMNLGADMLGLGNAATPFGVEAVRRMNALGTAEVDIRMFLVLNAATIQLFPTTVIALRTAAGSATPADILPGTVICSTISMLSGILAAKLFARMGRRHG